MKYRTFRDHAGRIHRVKMSRDEIRSNRIYWTCMSAVSVLFLVVTSIAAGLL